METVSVILQVASYKLTGQRIFRMAPIHHHFELMGWPEPKVIVRFWIMTVILVFVGFVDPKITINLKKLVGAGSVPARGGVPMISSIVMGLGVTGLSCVTYFDSQGRRVVVMDTRENPPNLDCISCNNIPILRFIPQDFPEAILTAQRKSWSALVCR